MTIITTDGYTKRFEISLRSYDKIWNTWSPDCFQDLETTFPATHDHDADGVILASEIDVEELISWWTDEVKRANDDPDYEGDGLCACGREWQLTADFIYWEVEA